MLQYSLGPPYTRLPTPHEIRGAGATDQRSEAQKGKSAPSRIIRKIIAGLLIVSLKGVVAIAEDGLVSMAVKAATVVGSRV